MASKVPVVNILDDDDDEEEVHAAAAATPPALRKRSHGASLTPAEFIEAFSPTPPPPKRRTPASTIVIDDTPTPPKRRASVASDPPVSVMGDTPRSFVPCSLGPRGGDDETPNSVLLPGSSRFGGVDSETPGSVVPCSIDCDEVAETPGMTSPRSSGRLAAPGLPSAAKFSGVSCPISLDSDDELDDTVYMEPLTKLPSNTSTSPRSEKLVRATCTDQTDYSTTLSACKNNGTTSCGQPPRADFPCEDSTLHDTDILTENYYPQDGRHIETEVVPREQDGDKSHLIGEGKEKQQEKKKRKKKENVLSVEEKKEKQQEEKRLRMEERARVAEERKQKQLENKMQKEARKAELAELKKLNKEKEKWEKGKFALKCIKAQIDSSVVETGSVGGDLLHRFQEKELSFRVTANRMKGSILWNMEIPNEFSQDEDTVTEVPYILFVLQAEEFCDLVRKGKFLDHVHEVRSLYPTFTICYVTNKLMSYIKKREQNRYKNPSNSNSWKRPPVEEVLCKLATHYDQVHSRQCADEAEVADHIVGLTSSLATCKFRKPLTWLSVHANGVIIPKDFSAKDLAKKSTWFKSLIAIPKVQAKHAHAIYKKYPSMRSLLNVYLDDSKTVQEKERLLQDLKVENHLGDEVRRLGQVCSKRVYKIIMAEDGAMMMDHALKA